MRRTGSSLLKIRPSSRREAEDGDHQCDKHTGQRPNRHAGFAQVPGSGTKSVSYQKDPDEDRDRKSDESCYGTDGEESADRERAAKNQ